MEDQTQCLKQSGQCYSCMMLSQKLVEKNVSRSHRAPMSYRASETGAKLPSCKPQFLASLASGFTLNLEGEPLFRPTARHVQSTVAALASRGQSEQGARHCQAPAAAAATLLCGAVSRPYTATGPANVQ
eukprot:1212860-Pleurochrysis_carterae.AAC.1